MQASVTEYCTDPAENNSMSAVGTGLANKRMEEVRCLVQGGTCITVSTDKLHWLGGDAILKKGRSQVQALMQRQC